MIPYKISNEIIIKAKEWSPPITGKNTLEPFYGVLIGNIGEIIFQMTYPEAKRVSNTLYDCDFIIDGHKIDVKTHRQTSDLTTKYHHVHIEERCKNKDNDYYFFYAFNTTKNTIQALGKISKTEYFDKSIFRPKGYTKEYKNGKKYVSITDCYELRISDLYEPTQDIPLPKADYSLIR